MNRERQARRASREASAWLARLESEGASEGDRKAHARWLEQSAVNREEYEGARRIWSLAGRMSDPALVEPTQREEWANPRSPWRGIRVGSERSPAIWAVAAALILTFGLGIYLLVASAGDHLYQTAVGEKREIVLPDGSSVTLNTNSRLRVPKWIDSRRLALERGEAFFSVAHQPDRAFIVEAAGGAVRALGTKFNIRIDSARATVAIVEGRVEVSLPARSDVGTQRAILVAGEDAVYGSDGSFTKPEKHGIERLVAWRTGKFVFEGATLEEVVREVSRYWDGKVIIADAELKELRITGTFATNRIPELLQTLEKAAPIRVVTRDDNEVQLVAR